MLPNIINLDKLKITKNNRSFTVKYEGRRLPKIATHTRSVFLYGPFVIKIGDRWQTEQEIDFYKKIRSADKHYFPELIAFDREREIIVQEYVPLIMDSDRITKRISRTVARLIETYGIDDICDSDMFNWGLNAHTGKPVIFDLGISS